MSALAAQGVLAGRASAATTTPAEILIIRHGEEPDQDSEPHLSAKGKARAAALPKLFPSRFTTPAFLFAAKSKSGRSEETLQPLADALHLKLNTEFADTAFQALATELLKPAYAGSHVLICWHHGTIEELAHAVGVTKPPKWPKAQYDHVWQIKYTANAATFSDQPQHLLPGDK